MLIQARIAHWHGLWLFVQGSGIQILGTPDFCLCFAFQEVISPEMLEKQNHLLEFKKGLLKICIGGTRSSVVVFEVIPIKFHNYFEKCYFCS